MQFALDRVYALRQSCQPVQETEDLPEKTDIQFGWNWRVLDPSIFDVAISLVVSPSEERPDAIVAEVVGVFRYVSGEGSGVTFQNFVRENAPAILIPYAREIVSSMTSRSYHGTMYLPPINVHKVFEGISSAGGLGDEQIRGDPMLREQFGIAPDSTKTLPSGNSS